MKKKFSPIYNLHFTIYNRRKAAFTLVELMIVVAILGIVAAIVLPEFQNHAQQAKESAAKESLRILREAIDRFAIDHNDKAPGYSPSGNGTVLSHVLLVNLISGRYLPKIPKNPFNNKSTFLMIADNGTMPASATGTYGWIYQPKTKNIRLDWPSTDSKGISYFSY